MAAASVNVSALTGEALVGALDALAGLRLSVFRAFPYLYDGDLAYERRYLSAYAESAGAVVVGAFDGADLVGAATAAPMRDHAPEFGAPFNALGIDIGAVYYFGESVLLPPYRGRGIGHAFFDHREAAARKLGFAMASFCAVIRPTDHPARPADYRPLDTLWRNRGFAPVDGMIAHFNWKDIGDADETPHPMQFWLKSL